jgi:hypothetical protein
VAPGCNTRAVINVVLAWIERLWQRVFLLLSFSSSSSLRACFFVHSGIEPILLLLYSKAVSRGAGSGLWNLILSKILAYLSVFKVSAGRERIHFSRIGYTQLQNSYFQQETYKNAVQMPLSISIKKILSYGGILVGNARYHYCKLGRLTFSVIKGLLVHASVLTLYCSTICQTYRRSKLQAGVEFHAFLV